MSASLLSTCTVAAQALPPLSSSSSGSAGRPGDKPPARAPKATAKQPKPEEQSDTLHLSVGNRSHLYGVATLRKFFAAECAALEASDGKGGGHTIHLYMQGNGTQSRVYELKLSTNKTKNSFIFRITGLSRFIKDTGIQAGDLVRLSWAPEPEPTAAAAAAAGGPGGAVAQQPQRKVMVEVLGAPPPPTTRPSP
ncbi:hypothetical protein HYH02_009989 [Chlamydomonas schloesseri]|uniref:Uncharacterized protein n=1 Tax=Chlamydomonas schloesseri TaxID=2026947 RepID=A0A835W6N5_9CHLO|nr:hypothetical protein HYH02_009989 [Chlamydomonas schloesseri]|eukprot:KAG2441400.1 hypothetical protein HYH02_009989 [Chlamydomonas schloesseri]